MEDDAILAKLTLALGTSMRFIAFTNGSLVGTLIPFPMTLFHLLRRLRKQGGCPPSLQTLAGIYLALPSCRRPTAGILRCAFSDLAPLLRMGTVLVTSSKRME